MARCRRRSPSSSPSTSAPTEHDLPPLLDGQRGIRVVGEVKSGLEAITSMGRHPAADSAARLGIRTGRRAAAHSRAATEVAAHRVILLTDGASAARTLEALSHGARGYLDKALLTCSSRSASASSMRAKHGSAEDGRPIMDDRLALGASSDSLASGLRQNPPGPERARFRCLPTNIGCAGEAGARTRFLDTLARPRHPSCRYGWWRAGTTGRGTASP